MNLTTKRQHYPMKMSRGHQTSAKVQKRQKTLMKRKFRELTGFHEGRELKKLTNLQDRNNTDNTLHTKKIQVQIYLINENIYAQISTHSLF